MKDYKDDIIVFDLETQHSFDDVGGRNFEALKVSVLGYYSYKHDEYGCLMEHELGQFQNMLIDAQLVIGYNSNKFDLPVLKPYFSMETTQVPSLDLLEEITKTLGFRVSLDSVAHGTLNIGKTGHGLDAIEYYRKGEWEKLKSYCINDVKITKEVYDYGVRHGLIYFTSRDGLSKKSVPVIWKAYAAKNESPEDMQQYRLF